MIGEKIGVDKITLYGMRIAAIDFEFLTEQSQHGSQINVYTTSVDGEWRIEIADNYMFGDLVLGRRLHGSQLVEYTRLTMSPTNINGHNADNLRWVDYTACMGNVLEYIASQYRILLEAQDARVMQMEINCNIPLDWPYADYDRVIRLLLSFLPRHLRNSQPYTVRDSGEISHLIGNCSMGVRVYNKSTQLRGKFPKVPELIGDGDVMRIEMLLKTPDKIASALGSNCASKITDHAIAAYYRRCIIDTMERKYAIWIAQRQKALIRLIRKCRKTSSKNWHHLVMEHIRNRSEHDGVPYILDIEQVVDAIRLLPDKNRNCNRSIRALMGIQIDQDLYHRRDCVKIQWIFDFFRVS